MQFFTLKYANIFMLSFRVFCSINNGLEVHCLDISMYRRLDVAKIDHYIAIKLDKLPDLRMNYNKIRKQAILTCQKCSLSLFTYYVSYLLSMHSSNECCVCERMNAKLLPKREYFSICSFSFFRHAPSNLQQHVLQPGSYWGMDR